MRSTKVAANEDSGGAKWREEVGGDEQVEGREREERSGE